MRCRIKFVAPKLAPVALALLSLAATSVACKPAECDSVLKIGAELTQNLDSVDTLDVAKGNAEQLAKVAAGSSSEEISVLGKRAARVQELIEDLDEAEDDEQRTRLTNKIYKKKEDFTYMLSSVADRCL